jgi:glycosyltransferase involved in cell wall biosynthesis
MRVALFTDSYYEANGVARTTAALEHCARRRDLPLLLVHAGSSTRVVIDGSVTRIELKRWRPTSFGLEHDMRFDLAMWRHLPRINRAIRRFAPDVVHFTGPSDIGQLGAWVGHRSGIPMIGSWHTNLHEYAARRLRLEWVSEAMRHKARRAAEDYSLRVLTLFYKLPRVILAPNGELADLLVRLTGKPTFLISRGVDTTLFTPEKRTRIDRRTVNIGYVGRLSPEKSVRQLHAIQTALAADGLTNVRFTVVGDGKERVWLREHLRRAELTGVLRGEALATAYANMDLFVFPSETETVGNVVLEAMASGLPVVAMAHGGPKFIADPGRSAILAEDHRGLIDAVRALVPDAARRDEMRRAARRRALELSWDRVFDQVCRGYVTAMSLAQGTDGAQRTSPPLVNGRTLAAGSTSGARLPTGR